eukprot:12377201-Alexandrium_andersonii.AAC.1
MCIRDSTSTQCGGALGTDRLGDAATLLRGHDGSALRAHTTSDTWQCSSGQVNWNSRALRRACRA